MRSPETIKAGIKASLLANIQLSNDRIDPANIPSLAKQRTMYGLQFMMGCVIFGATIYVKGDGKNSINQIADQFTLWTNTILTLNATFQFVSTLLPENCVPEKLRTHFNNFMRSTQAALLPETASLALFIFINQHLFNVKSSGEMNKLLIAVQHLPSAAVTIGTAKVFGEKPSDTFLKAALSFFITRILYSIQYLLRDLFQKVDGHGVVGYSTFTDDQNHINYGSLAFICACFIAFISLAPTAAYLVWRGAESAVSFFAHRCISTGENGDQENLLYNTAAPNFPGYNVA